MDEIVYTIQEEMEVAQHPFHFCAGLEIIEADKFDDLAETLSGFKEVTKTQEEIRILMREQAKRFVACGGNHGDRYGVIRKNRNNGWQYFIDLIIVK